jgi:type IV pilus assembly protein PilW
MRAQGIRGQRGLTLVELMIALLLGLFVIGGVIFIFAGSKRSYTETEQQTRIADNGRFAVQLLEGELRLAGFFGEATAANVDPDGSLGTVSSDCTSPAQAYDVDNYLAVLRASGSGVAVGCVTDAVPASDVIVVKSVRPYPLSDGVRDNPSDDDGTIDSPNTLSGQLTYVISNPLKGVLFDGADTPPSINEGGTVPGGTAWEYRFQVFYARAGNPPQLARKTLSWNGSAMSVVTENLVEGVEQMRVRIGIDSNDDGEADRFVTADTAGIDWSTVSALELNLLVRGSDIDVGYTDARTYDLAGLSLTPGGKYRRVLVNKAVSLRNATLTIRGRL